MCGITGFMDFSRRSAPDEMHAVVGRMADTLQHRGPDDAGTWVDPTVGIALGHRRLAIVDLSPEGHQPMLSASGRYVIVFNGEVYNFRELRGELETESQERLTWHGHSDTEVMLAAFETWGIRRAVERFTGMFAFALWDRQERLLHLVRDRIGEKPLYYGWAGRTFLFGSELKSLRTHPDFAAEIDRHALALYMRHNCIPAPYSIYRGIGKLLPATMITISFGRTAGVTPQPEKYWDPAGIAAVGMAEPFRGSDHEAIDRLDIMLREIISRQMLADVPLGAFLSGGIDSSAIVALMQAQSAAPVRTFTIGIDEARFNEAPHAAAVARHLGTDHTELCVTPGQTLDMIPNLATLYDEPFGDSSQIPTALIAALTRKSVTVSLSGDGADELFAGYNRYYWGNGIWERIRTLPPVARGIGARTIRSLSPQQWDRLFTKSAGFLPSKLSQRLPGEKMHKIANIMTATSPEEVYIRLVSHWQDPADVVIQGTEPPTRLTCDVIRKGNFIQKMMYFDLISYLPDDILVKIDRAGMGASLETRMPFLDHHLAEFAWQLPLGLKIRNGQGKWLLRQLLYRYVPRELIERPKMGFGIPLDNWLRGPLRAWAEELLNEGRLRREGYLHPEPVRKKWAEHLSGRHDWQYQLWDVLMFQAWLERNSL